MRLKVYDTAIKRARKAGKLPHEANEVYDEIIAKLRRVIREAKMQKQERVEKEFHDLSMGRLPHSTFHTEWEYLLDEMEEAGVDMPTQDTLFRRYLSKVTPEFRSLVLGRTFSLDGEEKPPRKPKTWEEVAECIELELESRADARAPTDNVHSFGPPLGPSRVPAATVSVTATSLSTARRQRQTAATRVRSVWQIMSAPVVCALCAATATTARSIIAKPSLITPLA